MKYRILEQEFLSRGVEVTHYKPYQPSSWILIRWQLIFWKAGNWALIVALLFKFDNYFQKKESRETNIEIWRVTTVLHYYRLLKYVGYDIID